MSLVVTILQPKCLSHVVYLPFQIIQQCALKMLEKHKKHENGIAIWNETIKRFNFKC
jgi:hypothetical protein